MNKIIVYCWYFIGAVNTLRGFCISHDNSLVNIGMVQLMIGWLTGMCFDIKRENKELVKRTLDIIDRH